MRLRIGLLTSMRMRILCTPSNEPMEPQMPRLLPASEADLDSLLVPVPASAAPADDDGTWQDFWAFDDIDELDVLTAELVAAARALDALIIT